MGAVPAHPGRRRERDLASRSWLPSSQQHPSRCRGPASAPRGSAYGIIRHPAVEDAGSVVAERCSPAARVHVGSRGVATAGAAGPPTCFASAKTTVPARSTEGLRHFSCCGPCVVPHGPCAGATRSAARTLRVPRIRTSGAPSYGAGMRARLTQEVAKPSDAPDTRANRAHRLPSASAPVMDRLAGCAPSRLVGIIKRAHNTHDDENSRKASQRLNKPVALHVRDTLDWDPLGEPCPGRHHRRGVV
jgi:hypothetical protein